MINHMEKEKGKTRYTQYEIRDMNYELRTKKAFTIIELVVAVALLAMVISFTSIIFKVSIESHRQAAANAEIMQKLRAITDQFNRDFQGLRKDAPLMMWFDQEAADQRYDQIMFFADGDFQSIRLYSAGVPSDTGQPLRGNVARIYYGQANVRDKNGNLFFPWGQYMEEKINRVENIRRRILARRRHILTADTGVYGWFDDDFVNEFGATDGDYKRNNYFEHDPCSLAGWRVITEDPNKNDVIIATCFDDVSRPEIDTGDSDTLHMLMSEGVASFAIQWGYGYDCDGDTYEEYLWWPSYDPNGDLSSADSDFGIAAMDANSFGVYFNMPKGVTAAIADWYDSGGAETQSGKTFPANVFFPAALKFTFRLYDSRGIIEGGREFTHIIYLGD